MKVILQYWTSTLWGLVIFVLSTMSLKDTGAEKLFDFPHMDKLVHFGFYALLAVLMLFDHTKNKAPKFNHFITAFTICLVYGGMIEILQGSVFTDRSTELLDFIANTTGALIGCTFYMLLVKLNIINKYFKSRPKV